MIIILITVLVLIMFWQPQMSADYKPLPIYKPTKKQRYINNINRLMDQGHYDIVQDLLARTKYSRDELPLSFWREKVHTRLSRISTESGQVESLRSLEETLDS